MGERGECVCVCERERERERERWYSGVTRRTGRQRARVREKEREIDPTRPDKHDKPFNRRLCTRYHFKNTHEHNMAFPDIGMCIHSSRLAPLSLSNTQRQRVRKIHEGQIIVSTYKQAHVSLLLMNIYIHCSTGSTYTNCSTDIAHTYTEGQHTRGNTLSKSLWVQLPQQRDTQREREGTYIHTAK